MHMMSQAPHELNNQFLKKNELASLLGKDLNKQKLANEIGSYFDRLFPIMRSITGEGVRESLAIISEIQPLDIYEIPTGTKAFDWIVPKEWIFKEAFN